MGQYRGIWYAAAVGTLAGLVGSPAVLAADDSAGIEEVVVTAQFREQKLQDTPLSITAVDASLLTPSPKSPA